MTRESGSRLVELKREENQDQEGNRSPIRGFRAERRVPTLTESCIECTGKVSAWFVVMIIRSGALHLAPLSGPEGRKMWE